ncbi:low molecular weight protein-tyrosine-phosphatase [Clostridium sp. MD294]|uniref:low molecular weight protein-tyrosine-phosphatase n=1 Tax=Clostridium sp. MD294 TaxID=97138 RepID=UPI0002C9A398|nr:low molecular weight protein-tyrosine-phosphatase [Clostridium sp. MD294]NDO45512.1 low molecular weight phosphotyrosine protein phosphatase [Clostridium sp. MD294]USF30836.1 Low molecular weight protein-tyrosine-phosphatase YfkJ [Clostridium sp. MD294]
MINVLFVCHGNICRSPMAEFVLKDMVNKRGIKQEFFIASAATSTEEIGNSVHRGTREKLKQYGISTEGKYAVQLKKQDYQKYDYILAMDKANVKNTQRIVGEDSQNKVHLLLSYAEKNRDIADPWYTGDFDKTYDDIVEGCNAFLNKII